MRHDHLLSVAAHHNGGVSHAPRIIAGSARGRRLRVPETGVRPTKDRVKASVFSALDARGLLQDAVVLDLFAGCGALGLEALSRGAAQATFADTDRLALAAVRANVEAFGMTDRARVLAGGAEAVARGSGTADLAFVDPPYEREAAEIAALLAVLVERLPGGTIVLERPSRGERVAPPAGWEVTWERVFGDTLVEFLQQESI